MSSVLVLSIIIVAAFFFLCHTFYQSKIELDSVTIAAVEARAKKYEPAAKRSPGLPEETKKVSAAAEPEKISAPPVQPAVMAPAAEYEYRELLVENGDNYVIPQWMMNYFSSSDICHTLDASDRVVFITKLADPNNAEESAVDVSAECDMSTQTVSLKFRLGEGAGAENLKTKFYLFERGDLFELNRLVRQQDVRIDTVTRAADYSLEYVNTLHVRFPQGVAAQLKNVLSKIPA